MSYQIQNQIDIAIQKATLCVDEILLSVKNMRKQSLRSKELIDDLTKEKELLSKVSKDNLSFDMDQRFDSDEWTVIAYAGCYSSAARELRKSIVTLRQKYIDSGIGSKVPSPIKRGIKKYCRHCDDLVNMLNEAYNFVCARASSRQMGFGGMWHGGCPMGASVSSKGRKGFVRSLFGRLNTKSFYGGSDKGTAVKKDNYTGSPTPPPPISFSACSPMSDTVSRDNIKNIYGEPKEDVVSSVPRVDQVQFSAVAPETVEPGKYIPVNVIMYEDEFRDAVDTVKLSFGDNAKESKSGYKDVERNSRIKVVLSSPDVAVDDDCSEQIWNGKYLDFEFAVKIPKDFSEEQILFTATVYINDIIATKLKLILDCGAATSGNLKITRKDILSAFVSYASHDRFRVATVIQGMKMARPDMDIFFDIESLRSGQRWESTLIEEIDNRDILYLCWSKSARESEWVEKEWRYALESKGEDCIEPVPIDSPDVCPPPPELNGKHFNDKMLFVIKATQPTELNGPCFVRFSTGEVTPLEKTVTVIGKDRSRVDLCIDGNASVSRVHATLSKRDGIYYITDEASVNGTYVNGRRLQPNEEISVASESVIKLANEIFEIVY